ncbi:related to VPS71 - nucleosome-binding component of the SWR1 complex [Ustilago trichophora]|uniref:Related to VPS71 - nucleosome-binding component of the SWR1 complex n=1 Tax=Ustilago trichophora TaxID=86804 RepID=A0A5C3EBI3_9BASI|nr:related to VPS71 - nucleosome-binding component of the SWR1 complex [Ustilago trichophora]
MSTSVSLRKRRAVASRPITNRPQTITGQQNKALNEEQERERQAKELDARRRRARRRLDELERINYRDAPTVASTSAGSSSLDAAPSGAAEAATAGAADGESGSAGAGVSVTQRRRNQAEIKRILVGGRRNLHSIVEELVDQGRLPLRGGKGGANWRSARSDPSKRPGRKYCSICGYHGDLACIRCGHRYCSKKCRDVHDETRCERPLR